MQYAQHDEATSAEEFERLVIEKLAEPSECMPEPEDVESAVSFQDAGVMTYNRGVVVRTHDGAEFQVTIVRSA